MVPRQVESEVLEHLCMNVTDKSEAFCKTCEEQKEMGIKISLQSTHLWYKVVQHLQAE